jgi:hypothetical protein
VLNGWSPSYSELVSVAMKDLEKEFQIQNYKEIRHEKTRKAVNSVPPSLHPHVQKSIPRNHSKTTQETPSFASITHSRNVSFSISIKIILSFFEQDIRPLGIVWNNLGAY